MMTRHFVAPLLATVFVVACSAAPNSTTEDVGSQSQAQCANGVKAGCGDCYADPASPTGGYRECFVCVGNPYTETCKLPPTIVDTINATFTGHMWLWVPGNTGNQQFSYPVTFTEYSTGGWTMSIAQQDIPVADGLEHIYISASGPVTGDNVTLTAPISGAATATLTLSTTATINPGNGLGNISGIPFSNTSTIFQLVGEDPTGKYQAQVQGTITAWP
jgi:hypothetical protein